MPSGTLIDGDEASKTIDVSFIGSDQAPPGTDGGHRGADEESKSADEGSKSSFVGLLGTLQRSMSADVPSRTINEASRTVDECSFGSELWHKARTNTLNEAERLQFNKLMRHEMVEATLEGYTGRAYREAHNFTHTRFKSYAGNPDP